MSSLALDSRQGGKRGAYVGFLAQEAANAELLHAVSAVAAQRLRHASPAH